jgi:protein-tyrosine phosphatase
LKRKILFVCLGNICRSPLAEALFSEMVATAGLSGFLEADSCGTSGQHQGEEPDVRTLRNAKSNGIEIRHRSRQLEPADFMRFHLILTMDRSNYRNTLSLAKKNGHHEADIRLMRSFDPAGSDQAEVPDPWYGGEEGFEEVFRILQRSCQGLLETLRKEMAPQISA